MNKELLESHIKRLASMDLLIWTLNNPTYIIRAPAALALTSGSLSFRRRTNGGTDFTSTALFLPSKGTLKNTKQNHFSFYFVLWDMHMKIISKRFRFWVHVYLRSMMSLAALALMTSEAWSSSLVNVSMAPAAKACWVLTLIQKCSVSKINICSNQDVKLCVTVIVHA